MIRGFLHNMNTENDLLLRSLNDSTYRTKIIFMDKPVLTFFCFYSLVKQRIE